MKTRVRFADVYFEEITPYGRRAVMFWAMVNSMNRYIEFTMVLDGDIKPHAQHALSVFAEDYIFYGTT